MPSEDTKILEFNQYHKSNKAPLIIYKDLAFLTEKIDGCKNETGEHFPSGFSMSAVLSFKSIENKHDVHRGEDCMKSFVNL